MAESFVKTMKRDAINVMPRPDARTAVQNLTMAFEHYNEWHLHSALRYRSLREYLRRRQSVDESGTLYTILCKCLSQ